MIKYITNIENFGNIEFRLYNNTIYIQTLTVLLSCSEIVNCQTQLIVLSDSKKETISHLYDNLIGRNNICEILLNEKNIDLYYNYLNNYNKLINNTNKNFTNWRPCGCDKYNTFLKNKSFTIHRYKISIPNTKISINLLDRKSYNNYIYAYGFEYISYKLKKEYLHTKILNNDICENKKVKLFLYINNISGDQLKSLPMDEYKIILIECKYLTIHQKYNAIRENKNHIDNLKEYFETYTDSTFVLYGFHPSFSKDFLEKYYLENYALVDNVRFFI